MHEGVCPLLGKSFFASHVECIFAHIIFRRQHRVYWLGINSSNFNRIVVDVARICEHEHGICNGNTRAQMNRAMRELIYPQTGNSFWFTVRLNCKLSMHPSRGTAHSNARTKRVSRRLTFTVPETLSAFNSNATLTLCTLKRQCRLCKSQPQTVAFEIFFFLHLSGETGARKSTHTQTHTRTKFILLIPCLHRGCDMSDLWWRMVRARRRHGHTLFVLVVYLQIKKLNRSSAEHEIVGEMKLYINYWFSVIK